MNAIENKLLSNREAGRRSMMCFINCGDPNLDQTYRIAIHCARLGVDVLELGVPFDNSFSDGATNLKSHARALQNGVEFEDVIELVNSIRGNLPIPVVLLVDFRHSVRPRGIQSVVQAVDACGADGILLHGLPPLFTPDYLTQCNLNQIDPVFSLYPKSTNEKINDVVALSRGLIYLVTQYGRSGSRIDFRSPQVMTFFSNVRSFTTLPLLAGFGIKERSDIEALFANPFIDGIVIGSAIASIIERGLGSPQRMASELTDYLAPIVELKDTGELQV